MKPMTVDHRSPWSFGVVTDDESLARLGGAVARRYGAGGATATWQGTGEPPQEIQVEVVLSCPVCQKDWPARLKKVWVRLTDNIQRVGQECCPSCGQCTLEVTTHVPKQSVTIVVFIVTIFAAVPGLRLAPPQIRLSRVE
jgi:hypothetical protein